MPKKIIFSFFILTLLNLCGSLQLVNSQTQTTAEPYPIQELKWVQQTLQNLTLEQRIAQLFMVAAYSNKDQAHKNEIAQLVKNEQVGGLIFMQGTPSAQIELTNYYQSITPQVPLLIAQDSEWGLAMRLQNTTAFPKQLTLGAIQNPELIYKMGAEIARQCKRIGVHINFAPVIDVNTNARNPVIGMRAFGENKYNVAAKGIAYMQGLEMNGVMACAKHFPGHGNTSADSHETLPTITQTQSQLYDTELFTFQQLIQKNVGSIMVAHLAVPALDNTPIKHPTTHKKSTIPSTLSKKIISNLLKTEMNYKGLIFTDALNMKGVADFFETGVVDAKALIAGNDVLLFSQNVPKAIQEIKKAIQAGELTENELNEKVTKVLKTKYRFKLNEKPLPLNTQNIYNDLNNNTVQLLKRQLIENALTLLNNSAQLIPLTNLNQKQIASIALGATTLTPFQEQLAKYAPTTPHTLPYSATEASFNKKLEALKNFNTVIVSLHNITNSASKDYGLNAPTLSFIRRLQKQNTNVIITIFGNPYCLQFFEPQNNSPILMAYENNTDTENLAAQLLFGAIPAIGKLPITASSNFSEGMGLNTNGNYRLKYTLPEEVFIKTENLERPFDSIMQYAISQKATPSGVILVAKNNKVIFEKAYGYHTYSPTIKTQTTDIYDLASVTKIVSTTLALMQLYDQNKLNLNATLGSMLPELTANSNKQNLVLKQMLLHESGFKDWIAFYESLIPAPVKQQNVSTAPVPPDFTLQMARNMYLNKNYLNTVWQTINASPIQNQGQYVYSDLPYYYYQKYIEKQTQMPLNEYLTQQFYAPLGASTMGYTPLLRFTPRRIPPTENDTKWRNQLVQGTVHDPGAAMFGGVAGHAGLFSNAYDLATVMQMLLNEGVYGNQQYLNASTVKLFTSTQKTGNRRGLAFDKPDPDKAKSPCADSASSLTFGHTGFTGTCAWADPKNQLIFIFLSNRVYPDKGNYKLIKNGIRSKLHEVVYNAIAKGV